MPTPWDVATAGFTVVHRLDAIGQIVASGPLSREGALRVVDGVVDVEADGPIDIGPPDAPVS